MMLGRSKYFFLARTSITELRLTHGLVAKTSGQRHFANKTGGSGGSKNNDKLSAKAGNPLLLTSKKLTDTIKDLKPSQILSKVPEPIPNVQNKAQPRADRTYSSVTYSKTVTNAGQDEFGDGDNKKKLYKMLALALVSIAGIFTFYKLKKSESAGKGDKNMPDHQKKSHPPVKSPRTSDEIPDEIQYLLIGGGTASFSAFRAIKSFDPKAKVLVVAKEPHNPYMRPPLSKELFWSSDRSRAQALEFKQWNGTDRSIFYEPEEFYSSVSSLAESDNGGVSVAQGWSVVDLDVEDKIAVLDDGKKLKYKKCLIAVGGKPKNIPVFENLTEGISEHVTQYRGIADFQKLEGIIEKGSRVIAVVGGGFLGSELACSLSRRGSKDNLKVVQIFKESGNLAKILPPYLAEYTSKKVEQEGVHVLKESNVTKVEKDGNRINLVLDTGRTVSVDHVIVAVGIEPDTELASKANLEIDPINGGYLVNAEMQARTDVYVAGDCASFYDQTLGRRRIEHHDHAVVSGRLAGENMTGQVKAYKQQAMHWSEVGPDVGFEAVGIVDAKLPTVGVYALKKDEEAKTEASASADDSKEQTVAEKFEKTTEPPRDFNKGVIFYLDNDLVVGIVLWNLYNKIPLAKQVINERRKYDDLNEVAKLFAMHG